MRAVVDTDVVAYSLFGTRPFVDEADRFWHDATGTMAPAIWEAELANVVWMAIRAGIIAADEGLERLQLAARLGIQSVTSRSLWRERSFVPPPPGLRFTIRYSWNLRYANGAPLATFDSQVLSAFPDIAMRPGSLRRS